MTRQCLIIGTMIGLLIGSALGDEPKNGDRSETRNPKPEIETIRNPEPLNSLWTEASQSLYTDFKARKVGDVLTILVFENTTASAKADTKTAKAESGSMQAGLGPILSFILPELSAGGKTALSSTGSTTRSGSLISRLSVIVTEVQPNGVMKVEGTRSVQINGETQKMVLSGLVRVKDVTSENTIESSLVANAEIKFEGKGVIGSRQREGIITKIFKFLF